MSEIPQDVWDAADAAHLAAHRAETVDEEVNVIARAILAERKRCADVALTWPLCELTSAGSNDPKMAFEVGASAQRRAIASGILSGEQP